MAPCFKANLATPQPYGSLPNRTARPEPGLQVAKATENAAGLCAEDLAVVEGSDAD